MSKPSWSEAPDYAEWLVCDMNGDWIFCEKEPIFKPYIGFTDLGRHEYAGGCQGYKESRP